MPRTPWQQDAAIDQLQTDLRQLKAVMGADGGGDRPDRIRNLEAEVAELKATVDRLVLARQSAPPPEAASAEEPAPPAKPAPKKPAEQEGLDEIEG